MSCQVDTGKDEEHHQDGRGAQGGEKGVPAEFLHQQGQGHSCAGGTGGTCNKAERQPGSHASQLVMAYN